MVVMVGLLAGCAPEADRGRGAVYDARAGQITAGTEATRVAVDYQQQVNVLQLQAQATAQAVSVQATVTAIGAQAEAHVTVTRAVSVGGVVFLGALALVAVILAGGWSVSRVRASWVRSAVVEIGAERLTMLPAPYVIVGSQVLDTRGGASYSLRDPQQVDALRLQLTATATERALQERAAVEIGRAQAGRRLLGG